MLPTVQWHLRENGALKNDKHFFKVCVAVFEKEKNNISEFVVFIFGILLKEVISKTAKKKKKIINEGKWSDDFSFLTSDKLPQIIFNTY